jgi:hypothetical protein
MSVNSSSRCDDTDGSPAAQVRRRLRLVRQQQELAARSITFSVTRRCPLTCAHCNQESGPKVDSAIMSLEFGQHVAAQLPELQHHDLAYVGFTGGEPTLACDFVRCVSDECFRLGIKTGITSAANWAHSDASTERMLDRLPHLTRWDLSTDRYHLEHVPLEQIERAFRALSERGRPPLVRFAYHVPESPPGEARTAALEPEDAELVRRIHGFAGERISFQPVQARGRGRTLTRLRAPCADRSSSLLCLSQGLLIDERGIISPCGSLQANEPGDHPLRMGNAFSEPLLPALQRWRHDPVLQLLRLGSVPVLLAESNVAGLSASALQGDSDCERCVSLTRKARLLESVLDHAGTPEVKRAMAEAAREAYGNRWPTAAAAGAPTS